MNLTNFIYNISFLIISFGLNFFLIKALLPILRQNLLDKPNARSSHIIPKPSGGGIAFFLVTLLFLFFTEENLWLYFLPLGVVSFLDDLFKVSAKIRYSVQFLTSILIVISFSNYIISSNLLLNSFYFLFLIVLGTALINFFNFMDGVDGLLAGTCLIIFSFLACHSSSFITPLIGGLIAFILFNWMPSKIFMGDIGSTFLGAYFFYFVVSEQSPSSSLALLLLSMPLLADCTICIFRRLYYGQNIFLAHKLHLYQRLNQGGSSHAKVSACYILYSLFMGLGFIYIDLAYIVMLSLLLIVVGIFLGEKYAIPFEIAQNEK